MLNGRQIRDRRGRAHLVGLPLTVIHAVRFTAAMRSMPALHGDLPYTAQVTFGRTITTATTTRIRNQRIRASGGVCAS
jgi:hypothetical protein